MTSRSYIFLICFGLTCMSIHAQRNDFQTWINMELNGEILKRIDYALVPELRLCDNSSRVSSMIGEVEVSVPIIKFLRTGLVYRYERDIEEAENPIQNNRFSVFMIADYKIDRLKLAYRAMYFQEYSNWHTSENGNISKQQHRHKISVKYNIKGIPLTPVASAEMFYCIRPEWNANQYKLRTHIGVEYKIKKNLVISAGYKFQREFNENDPLTLHVLGLGLEYKL